MGVACPSDRIEQVIRDDRAVERIRNRKRWRSLRPTYCYGESLARSGVCCETGTCVSACCDERMRWRVFRNCSLTRALSFWQQEQDFFLTAAFLSCSYTFYNHCLLFRCLSGRSIGCKTDNNDEGCYHSDGCEDIKNTLFFHLNHFSVCWRIVSIDLATSGIRCLEVLNGFFGTHMFLRRVARVKNRSGGSF